jgi:DNA (cytosine-5)-methyltransferase 1
VKHLGDITKIDGRTVPVTDVVVGGSPCQDLSIAGKREGLAGARSGLFMEQINGKGSCLWASEIEEFPMAVTRLRFKHE